MSYVTGFIPDGYTAHGYLAPEPLMFPELRFEYRPLAIADRSHLFHLIERQEDRKKAEAMAAKAMQKQLISWSLKDASGESVPLSWENILRLQPTLNTRLFAVICGTRASDDDPELSSEERGDALDREMNAYLGDDAKN